ncbi:unnamed protein product [Coffea canephora]|uniref:Uncharacterized protein n=1 Tax=Coffea canephora TaxID=49390 RepID=A0A068TSW7_COFCA|nr:unnamed protein product [Coffea canephora]
MLAIIDANLRCKRLVNQLSSQNKRRWHSAFVTIYCSRAFKYALITTKKTSNISQLSPDRVTIDVIKDYSNFFNVDQPSLTKLVRDKSLGQLVQFGGIQGIVTSLNTEVQHGLNGDDDEDILSRIEAFGSNTYRKPPKKGFFHFNGPKEGWYDGGSIFVAVFLVISVSAISNFRQNLQFEKLSKVSSNIPVEVLRNGRRQQISIFYIVVGDVVCLKIGDQVPADGLFLEGHSLRIDESSMTGESDHLEVNQNQNPFLTSGTKVADGYGQMLVTSVGMNTTWGEMMSSVSQDSNEKTPLQSRLNKLTSAIGKVGLAVAFLVLLADDVINAVVKIIAAAVTIVVVAIPEGLPLAVTLTLAYSMKRMMADQAMVRKLSACETMGSATTICTDKTGTLTLNRMTVTKFWLGKESVEKDSYLLNTTGSVYRSINLGTEGLEFSGSPTEKAILSWAVMEINMDMERVKQNCSILHVEAFNSQKKRKIIQGMAASSLRCIAFAHKQIREANDASGEIQQTLEDRNLILLGIVGLKDPCRPGVKKAVEDCQYSGVKIKMITGDNVFTARAIATECGILKPDLEANDELHLMVKCLKAKGHVVAVTGDGTNDAPALKEADIGLSMGIQGTEVAKESSDIVILDDNFASVATVLTWGRCVYSNIQKFIQFQLTVNVAALVINFVAAISAGEVPLTAVQLLNLMSQALYQIAVLLTLQFKGKSIFGVSKKVNDTLIFNTFVLCQVFNEFNARKLERKNVFEGIHRNKLFLGIIGVTIILQVVMVEFLKRFANTERLNWGQWAACAGIAAASWPIGWIVKCIPVPDRPVFSYLKWKNFKCIPPLLVFFKVALKFYKNIGRTSNERQTSTHGVIKRSTRTAVFEKNGKCSPRNFFCVSMPKIYAACKSQFYNMQKRDPSQLLNQQELLTTKLSIYRLRRDYTTSHSLSPPSKQ